MDCPTDAKQFGPHGGKQFRIRNYCICGCDAGYCETHAIQGHKANPFGPKAEKGKPKKCRKHRTPKI